MVLSWAWSVLFVAGFTAVCMAETPKYNYLDGDAGPPWEVCAECHGLDGVSWSNKFPNMAAQPKDYLLAEMRNFRDHSRDNDDHQMTAVLSNLSPSTMAEIADWYATQPPAPPAAADLSPKQRAWAEQVVRQGKGVMRGCDYCHGKTELRGVVMPRIDGERAGYLARQLRDFRDGRRADDPRELMRKVAKTLEPDQIDVLAAYLASLPRAAPSQRRSSE